LGLQWGLGLPLLLGLMLLYDLPLWLALGILVLEESLRLFVLTRRLNQHSALPIQTA
jgi:Na+-driven multidrug efflux pump